MDKSFRKFTVQVIDTVASLQRSIGGKSELRVNLRLARMLREFLRLQLPTSEWSTQAIQQLDEYLARPSEQITCVSIDHRDETLVVGFVRPSKAPDAFFEAAVFRREEIPDHVARDCPSIACPVQFLDGTDGLKAPEMLGLFAEHFGFGNKEQQSWPGARAYYLTDRFQARFARYTLPLLNCTTSDNSMPNLREWTSGDWRDGFAQFPTCWLAHHEHNHGVGDLPFHQHFTVKWNRLAAGYEELRADLMAIVALWDSRLPNARAIAEYILCERLLVYPVVDLHDVHRQRMTFDSVGSHFLHHELLNAGNIRIVHGRLELLEGWPCAIRKVLGKIEAVEARVKDIDSHHDEEKLELARKEELLRFINGVVKAPRPEVVSWREDPVPMFRLYHDAYTACSSYWQRN